MKRLLGPAFAVLLFGTMAVGAQQGPTAPYILTPSLTTLPFLVTGAITATTIQASGLITATAGLSAGGATFLSLATRGFWQATADGIWELLNAAGTRGLHYEFGGVPAIGACGTSPPAMPADSTNSAGVMTTGTATPASCVLTFNGTWNKAPICTANVATATAGNVRALGVTTTTTTMTITPASVFADSSVLFYQCLSVK